MKSKLWKGFFGFLTIFTKTTRSLIKRKIVSVMFCKNVGSFGKQKKGFCRYKTDKEWKFCQSIAVLLTTVLKNGCLRHSRTVIRFSGSTTRHLRIKSLGSSENEQTKSVSWRLKVQAENPHRRCPTIQVTWNCTCPPWYCATLSSVYGARMED